jgi:hypothetical protein
MTLILVYELKIVTMLCALFSNYHDEQLGCGMQSAGTTAAAAAYDDWMVSGRYGVVQMFDSATEPCT